MMVADGLSLRQSFPKGSKAPKLLADFARQLASLVDDSETNCSQRIEVYRRQALQNLGPCAAEARPLVVAAIHVLADLAKQGWEVRAVGKRIQLGRPADGADDGDFSREHLRSRHEAERDEQLRQPAAAEFVRSMERRRLFGNQFVSIFSLMRDGKELAGRLAELGRIKSDNDRLQAAGGLIQPYLQFVRGEECCEYTGLRLVDVWRYFRHTWASPYKSVPGRSMMIFVRDAAAPCHPVIGIAALSSAAVAVTVRDELIGWTPVRFLEEIKREPTAKLAVWLQRTLDQAIKELYTVDLIERGLLSTQALKRPTLAICAKLERLAKRKRQDHRTFMKSGEYKKSESASTFTEENWEDQARSLLFLSKRALDLAQLLRVRMLLTNSFGKKPSQKGLLTLASTGAGRDAITRILRKAKADRVGTAIADLTVCGAIPPYSEILGGKLVAMLMTSPEVITEYRRRYGRIPSVIASSMAGRAITRPADLVYIGTTSLYGQRPCQYDRISIPGKVFGAGNDEAIRYEYLGRTEGIGTFHFGPQTVKALAILLDHSGKGQQVNYVFGEGSNPRLRQIRGGIGELGLSADQLLKHGIPRLVYGVRLAHNLREYLLGLAKRPKYIVPQDDPATTSQRIAQWWLERWLLGRAQRPEVIERVVRHNFVHPIRHGARVFLPRADLEQQVLFEDWDEDKG